MTETHDYSGLLNSVTQGDCLEVMRLIPDKSIDMILCDLPYGTTSCKWDTVIPFEPLWEQYERIIKDNGAIVLTASQPFTTLLINSNFDKFKYSMVWEKSNATGFAQAKKRPLKIHEDICVFYKKQPTYNPQKWVIDEKYRDKRKSWNSFSRNAGSQYSGTMKKRTYRDDGTRYPQTILSFPSVWKKGMHPTQKPVALFEYLIRTYTNEGEIVLDNCIGSGTTAVAAINTNRQFIGIEREPEYVEIANKRIAEAMEARQSGAS